MDNLEDVSVILNLQSDGPAYLDGLLKSFNDDDSKQKIIPFIKTYLDTTDIFEDSTDKYVEYIVNIDDELWKTFSRSLSDDDIIRYIKTFVYPDKLNFASVDIELKFFDVLITPLNVKNLLKTNTVLWNVLFDKLLLNINLTNDNWINDIKHIQMFIKNIIANKDNKDYRLYFIKWISSILNIFIKKIHLNVQVYDTKLPTDYYIANIIALLFAFWNEGFAMEKLNMLDYDYVVSDKCYMNWFDKKLVNDTKTYNFLTQCYFLLIDALRVGYIPIMSRSIRYDKLLEQIDNEINTLSSQVNVFTQFILTKLYNEKQIVKDYLEIDTNIINNNELKQWIINFYDTVVKWIDINKEKNIDDILSDMIYFYNNNKDNTNTTTDYNVLCELSNNIISTKLYTNNISIKCDFMKFISDTLNANQITIVEYIINEYVKSLLILHNELHHANIRPDYKMIKKLEIYKAYDTLYISKDTSTHAILLKQFENNLDLTRKFISTFLMDVCQINDTINSLYKNIDNNIEEDDETLEDTKYNIHAIFLYIIKISKLLNKFVNIFSKNTHIWDLLISKEIFTSLSSIINSSITFLTTRINYDPTLGFSDCEFEKNLDIELFMTNLSETLNTIYINGCDLNILIDSYGFDMENYNNFSTHTPVSISLVLEKIQSIYVELNNNNTIDPAEIPFEFTDPITYTLIDEPCLLPNMVGFSEGDTFFDKSTILKSMLIKEENPFTREPLTLDQFNKFNSLPEIKTKTNEFKDRINMWKKTKI
ncbi:ubiquitin conjugation factor E4 with U-box domain [Fadolivirus algeromassiliense]|jgi:hypothetical protein|uniref:Ubiquitin conjugation factor E4 with U-box domain n=1 Tax=Fadolivirus FV1/VV64 TaxID=3070911 RepID=A0A7D3QVW2_9VIRU|nr:ubiquitin conjugation factor E4 with U-box domain [Fadolivirus algeromassiliense]QKF93999.1 ubiquitin conjugation factor E4 with U-box domain [Fadolivirus FV1/VV64]